MAEAEEKEKEKLLPIKLARILVKLLQQAESAFPQSKQSKSLKLPVKPMIDSLITHGLFDHKDRDSRVLVGTCLSEIIRVLAPDPEFSLAVSRELSFSEEHVQSSDALVEMSQGHWEGCHRLEIYTPETLSLIEKFQPDFTAPSGESLRQVEFRMVQFLNSTIMALPDKHRSDFAPPDPNDNPSLLGPPPGWPESQHRHRHGLHRKKSGKSRLQIVTTTGYNEADDKMSPRVPMMVGPGLLSYLDMFAARLLVFGRTSFDMFGELGDIARPFFSKRAKILETVAKLGFCLTMLDTGCEDLVNKMFKSFFGVVREDHPQSLINSMSSIMKSILEETLDADHDPLDRHPSHSLLDVVLPNIIKDGKCVESASYRLAVSVIQSCGTEQVDARIKALNLLRKLLALHGQQVAWDYPDVFLELLNRFSNKSAEVRLTALACAEALYKTNHSGRE
ncbi:hypothetical protein CASFOL_014016 [Castilleja foliolosa]|uniref:ARM repeat superfamily protein n=1 Tax=Castilleja foliolosa TaxID=1961234 RepID=A0ABD3DND5_9LAMI